MIFNLGCFFASIKKIDYSEVLTVFILVYISYVFLYHYAD